MIVGINTINTVAKSDGEQNHGRNSDAVGQFGSCSQCFETKPFDVVRLPDLVRSNPVNTDRAYMADAFKVRRWKLGADHDANTAADCGMLQSLFDQKSVSDCYSGHRQQFRAVGCKRVDVRLALRAFKWTRTLTLRPVKTAKFGRLRFSSPVGKYYV